MSNPNYSQRQTKELKSLSRLIRLVRNEENLNIQTKKLLLESLYRIEMGQREHGINQSIVSGADPSHPLRVAFKTTMHTVPTSILLLLLQQFEEDVFSFGEKDGKTLLHLACQPLEVDMAVVEQLLHIWPQASAFRDPATGNFPLHMACQYGVKDDIVMYLQSIYPAAVHKKNKDGFLPIHLIVTKEERLTDMALPCLQRLSSPMNKSEWDDAPLSVPVPRMQGGWLPLHLACFHASMNANTLQTLLDAYPLAARLPSGPSRSLPLHIAIQSECSIEVLHVLYQAYPQATLIRNSHGETPLSSSTSSQTLWKHFQSRLSIIETQPQHSTSSYG